MWPKLVKQLAKYPTAVLTGLDGDGYPFSLRCVPEADAARQVLLLKLPDTLDLQTGPAGLLCHYHDDLLWNQTNLMVRGTLERGEGGWLFRPTQMLEGAGAGMSMLRQIRDGRRAAQQYLTRRHLPRPKVPWDQLKAIYEQAQNLKKRK